MDETKGVEKKVLGDDLNDWLKVIHEINSGGGSAIIAGETCPTVELAISDYVSKHGIFNLNRYYQNSYDNWILNSS